MDGVPSLLASFLTPESPASPNANDIQTIYVVMMVIVTLLGLAINAALIAAIVKFRGKRADAPPRRTAGRGVVPRVAGALGALALIIFVLGIVFTEEARQVEASGPDGLQAASSRTAQVQPTYPTADDNPLTINVVGQQWLWRYEYPEEKESDDQSFNPVFSYGELVVPVDTAVALNVTSTDVIHRWGVPALSGKVDAVPGITARAWFKAEEEGTYDGQSYQYSGPGYSTMRTQVRVVSTEEYETWIETQREEILEAQESVLGTGETSISGQSG